MCYYQDIHAARHYALLNVDVDERQFHFCRLMRPWRTEKDVEGHEIGVVCKAHRCCRVRREIVKRCKRAEAGEEGCGDDSTFGEDVFVLLEDPGEASEETEGKDKAGEGSTGESAEGAKQNDLWLGRWASTAGYLVEVLRYVF